MSRIIVDNLSIKFRIYHDRLPSLKDFISSLFRHRHLPRYSDFFALNGISVEIKEGERVGIIGPNGAGKSTFLKALCRIYEPSSGQIQVEGRIAPLLEVGAGFHPEFTGRENIYLNGAILGYSTAQIKAFEPEVVAFTEMENFIDTPVKYYSTGMYLRLAFAIATAAHPDILILDELFAGGDASFVKKATSRMEKMIDHANIMVLVSHDMGLLKKFCERILWIDHGKLKEDGPTEQVIAHYMASQNAVEAA